MNCMACLHALCVLLMAMKLSPDLLQLEAQCQRHLALVLVSLPYLPGPLQ